MHVADLDHAFRLGLVLHAGNVGLVLLVVFNGLLIFLLRQHPLLFFLMLLPLCVVFLGLQFLYLVALALVQGCVGVLLNGLVQFPERPVVVLRLNPEQCLIVMRPGFFLDAVYHVVGALHAVGGFGTAGVEPQGVLESLLCRVRLAFLQQLFALRDEFLGVLRVFNHLLDFIAFAYVERRSGVLLDGLFQVRQRAVVIVFFYLVHCRLVERPGFLVEACYHCDGAVFAVYRLLVVGVEFLGILKGPLRVVWFLKSQKLFAFRQEFRHLLLVFNLYSHFGKVCSGGGMSRMYFEAFVKLLLRCFPVPGFLCGHARVIVFFSVLKQFSALRGGLLAEFLRLVVVRVGIYRPVAQPYCFVGVIHARFRGGEFLTRLVHAGFVTALGREHFARFAQFLQRVIARVIQPHAFFERIDARAPLPCLKMLHARLVVFFGVSLYASNGVLGAGNPLVRFPVELVELLRALKLALRRLGVSERHFRFAQQGISFVHHLLRIGDFSFCLPDLVHQVRRIPVARVDFHRFGEQLLRPVVIAPGYRRLGLLLQAL